jgi:hypothetical protein
MGVFIIVLAGALGEKIKNNKEINNIIKNSTDRFLLNLFKE